MALIITSRNCVGRRIRNFPHKSHPICGHRNQSVFLPVMAGVLLTVSTIFTQTLPLPPRPQNAPKGRAFITQITNLSREERETQIFNQIVSGNIPDFLRNLVPVNITQTIGGVQHTAIFYVTCDYLAVGADDDYFLTPMTPLLAQKIADTLNCILPTKKMVDDIYGAAAVKLRPQPIAPSDAMITVPVFAQHNDSVWTLRQPLLGEHPLGQLVGGTKKDVIISNKIYSDLKPAVPKPVVIYGWHKLDGTPIQPVYNGHGETYADYSHGIRLVQKTLTLDGNQQNIPAVLNDASLHALLSDEGLIPTPRYGVLQLKAPTPKSFGIIGTGPNSLCLRLKATPNTTYAAYLGTDGLTFPDTLPVSGDSIIISGLTSDQVYYVRLRAFNADGGSNFSETLAASLAAESPAVLIINGFDRATTAYTNTYNYIRYHARAFADNGIKFASASNDAILDGLFDLDEFAIVDYLLGEESTVDETFNSAEQLLVQNFLQNGGKLFVSGSEIAWDLDYKGSSSDKYFYNQFLKAQYIYDAPNNQPGLIYRSVPVTGGILDGLGNLYYDNGSRGIYNVKYPDVINGINGGINCLAYASFANNFAGVCYAGLFPGGSQQGAVVNLGIPFETFYPDSNRAKILNRVLNFFAHPEEIQATRQLAETFRLTQNFPNPFNAQTMIPFHLQSAVFTSLKIFNLNGAEVATLVESVIPAGDHTVTFNATELASGVYLYRLMTPGFTATRKMEILK